MTRATPLSEQDEGWFPHFVEPGPTVPLKNTPPPLCQDNKVWACSISVRGEDIEDWPGIHCSAQQQGIRTRTHGLLHSYGPRSLGSLCTSSGPWQSSKRCCLRQVLGLQCCSRRGGGRTAHGGTGHLGLTHTETQRGRLWTACGQRRMDSKNSQTTPATTSTSSIRQLLGAADAQTAHQTTGLRDRGNDTSRSTGRSGRQKAATRRNMRREERVTVQGPVKEQQPDGMSQGGACENNSEVPKCDKNNTSCCSDAGIVCARREKTQAVTIAS